MSVNKSNTHSLRCHTAHTLTHCSPFTCGLSSCPKPSLKLPVFLRVSVKCIHMLLRGLRLEGDCFASDKNHLAPSEESAWQHRTAQNRTAHRSAAVHSTALAQLQCIHSAGEEDKPHMGLKQYQGSAT